MATHHSVSDWDLTDGWSLDTSTYVSSPSSIKFNYQKGATCKRSEVWNISQGMIVTYAKTQYEWGHTYDGTPYNFGLAFGFRNQATSGHGLSNPGVPTTGYALVINGCYSTAEFWRDASKVASVSLIAKPTYINAWNKYRATWWSDTGGAGLFARLEYWNGTEWVKMVNDFNDTTDKYKNSTVNRISIASYSTYDAWFDDTEIWGT